MVLALLLAVAVARPQFAGNRPVRPLGGTFAFPPLGKFLCQPSLETFINLEIFFTKVLEAALEPELVTLDPQEYLHQA